MNFLHRTAMRGGLLAVWTFAAIGCEHKPETLPDVTVNVPDHFELDGTRWQKQSDVQPADNECLTKFFAVNQDLVDSPEFEGQPEVFRAGKNDRRFYWLNAATDGMNWQCVEFRKRKFSVSDGTENPFE